MRAFDKNRDICGTVQLVIFIKGTEKSFNITEKMATLFPLESTTKGDGFSTLCLQLLRDLKLNSRSIAVIDGALVMLARMRMLYLCFKNKQFL